MHDGAELDNVIGIRLPYLARAIHGNTLSRIETRLRVLCRTIVKHKQIC